MSATVIRLTDAERLVVEGPVEEVEKLLSDAARSGQSRLAWLTDLETNQSIAVNPMHVVSLRSESQPIGDRGGDARSG